MNKVKKPIASVSITYLVSLNIYSIDESGERVEAGLSSNIKRDTPRFYKLHQSVKKGAFFRYKHHNWYMSDLMKVSI